jgi:surface antigen
VGHAELNSLRRLVLVHSALHRPRALVAWGVVVAMVLIGPGASGQVSTGDDTFSDRLIINRRLQEQLEKGRSNQPVEWHNPKTGHGGSIVVFPATPRDDTYCRPYEFTWIRGNRSARYRGMPCRTVQGIWANADELQIPVLPPGGPGPSPSEPPFGLPPGGAHRRKTAL